MIEPSARYRLFPSLALLGEMHLVLAPDDAAIGPAARRFCRLVLEPAA